LEEKELVMAADFPEDVFFVKIGLSKTKGLLQ